MPRGGHTSRVSSSASGGINASTRDLDLSDAPPESEATSRIDASGRLRVTIEKEILMPTNDVAKAITTSFKRKIHPEGITWKCVSADMRQSYFEEFEKLFFWDPQLNAVIKAKWTTKAGERYKDLIYKMKKDSLTKKPPYVSQEVWSRWLAVWDSDPVKEKAEKAKKNRLAEPNGPGTSIVKHRGGSRSALQYAVSLARDKGVSMDHTAWEVFNRLHCNNGVYSDTKSAHIAAEVLARSQLLSQPAEGSTEIPEVNMNKIYLEVVGVTPKKWILGVGCQSLAYSASGSSTQSVTSSLPVTEDIVAEIRAEVHTQVRAEMQAQLQAERDGMRAELRAELQADQKAMFSEWASEYLRGPPPS